MRRSDQQRSAKTAGGWLPFGLSSLDKISKNGVGRTGFEPVTSSVSGKPRPISSVCLRRTESNGEPLTCTDILRGSGCVRGRLIALAPISGSHLLQPLAARRPADNRLPGAAAATMMLARWRLPRADNGRHPMASEELATVHELLRGFDLDDLTITDRRAAMASVATPPPPGTTVEPVDAGEYRPSG